MTSSDYYNGTTIKKSTSYFKWFVVSLYADLRLLYAFPSAMCLAAKLRATVIPLLYVPPHSVFVLLV